ncbi:MAG TPA: MFS transporter [Candidatus Limnocylindrales bacterium]|nr:MFS transporter [Candidatus Limnocylindrales bacterium]
MSEPIDELPVPIVSPAAETFGEADEATPGAATSPRQERNRQSLAGNRDFRVLLVSQGVSSLGDAVSFTALPLLVLALTGSGVAMGVVGALQTLPDLVFGMVAGALADRSDRKRMMFGADLGRAVLTALIPLSVILGGPTMAIILVVAAPMSMLRSLFLAGYTASVPSLVGRAQLARANGIFETVYSAGYIVGPSIAGLLAAVIGPGLTLGIDAISFALSSLGLFLVQRSLRAPVDRPRTRIIDDIREGIQYIVHHPLLRSAILLWGISSIVTAPIVAALAFRVTRDLGLSSTILGVVLTAYGVGTVAGSLGATRLGRRANVAVVLLVGEIATGLALVGVAALDPVPIIVGLAIVAGVAQSLVLVTYITLRTAHSPDHLLGRIGSTARVISLGLQPVGMLVGGVLIDAIGGSRTIAAMGAALCVLAIAFVPVRALRTTTMPPRSPSQPSGGG